MTASSFAVMGVQLGYAAITSRLLAPSAFGAYAVALSGVGFMGMLGGSSLGQAAARRDHDSVHLDRSLVTLALVVGCSTAMLVILLAPLWGRLWGVPESTQVTRVLALGIPVSALSAVLAGVLRRSGRTTQVAGRTGLGQLAGMAVGLTAILGFGTPWSLGVAPTMAQLATAGLISAALPRDRLKPARPTTASLSDAIYGAKAAGMNLLRYSTSLFPVWAIGRYAGPSELGAYNRATTLVTVPMEALQQAFSYTIFPELRQGGPVSQRDNGLTDIVIMMTWPALFLAGVGYFAAPPAVALLLGPGWEQSKDIAGIALLLGVVPMVSVLLGSALEAQGRFRATSAAWLLATVAIVIGTIWTASTGAIMLAVLTLLVAKVVQGSVFAVALARVGQLSPGRWARETIDMIGLQTAVALPLWCLTASVENDAALLGCIGLVAGAEAALLWHVRVRTRFGILAVAYGLPGFR